MIQIKAAVSESLYERIQQVARSYEGSPEVRLERAIADLLAKSLNDKAESPLNISDMIGQGAALWPTDRDWEEHQSRSRAVPWIEVAALARPDGETERLSVLLPDDIAVWLDERLEVLSLIPEIKAFYGTIDSPTVLRHVLAQTLLSDLPLTAIPSSEGKVQTVYLPKRLGELLAARLDALRAHPDVRANAGLGTVVRYVLAAAMADAHR